MNRSDASVRVVNDRLFSRRTLLGTFAAGLATASLSRVARASIGANDEIRLAFIGAGDRTGVLVKAVKKCKGVKMVAVADPDLSRAEKFAETIGARAHQDLRHILDDPDIDAVVIATCNHWHCLASIWAIQAGKDVYVEKPLSHSQWEGRRVCDVAKQANAIVQLGTQQRSDTIQAKAKQLLHQDKSLGEIRYVQANRLGIRKPIGKRSTPLNIPSNVDYDLWLGPAADVPILRDQLHYDWHWDFNTGCGEMGNWGVHVLDDVRNVAYQDKVSLPSQILTAGGRVAWDDAGDTPNVHFARLETEMFPTLMSLSNLPAKPKSDQPWTVSAGNPIRVPDSGYAVVCEGGYYLGQRGRGKAIDLSGKTIREFRASQDNEAAHMQNFLDAVRSRNANALAAPIESGHYSTGWCNLTNAAFRSAGAFDRDVLESASDRPEWLAMMDEMTAPLAAFNIPTADLKSSPMLAFDVITERFTGDHADVVNAFLKRDYRPGYEIT